jgi:hypothetical protein
VARKYNKICAFVLIFYITYEHINIIMFSLIYFYYNFILERERERETQRDTSTSYFFEN